MEHRGSRRRIVVGAVLFLVLPVFIVAGVLIGASGPDDGSAVRATRTSTVEWPATTPELADDKFAALEAGGDVRTMVERHQAMMDEMRATATPQMLELMNDDPMWQMMRSGEYIRLLEEHEENIDRMLGRSG